MKKILFTLALLISFSSFGQMTEEERIEKMKTESYLFDKDYKDIDTVCEALDATFVLMKELITLAEATSFTGVSELKKQEYWTWMAKYYSFNRHIQIRFKELGDLFSEEFKDCSNYFIYESLKNKIQSEQIGSQIELLSL